MLAWLAAHCLLLPSPILLAFSRPVTSPSIIRTLFRLLLETTLFHSPAAPSCTPPHMMSLDMEDENTRWLRASSMQPWAR
ncbi:hypothetical protein C8R45DRAFT_1038475 [Mycena sanguinolenta]|nr:hypothetical protein C8R45DRAFT_1038475 [Mycena sanguinolenta]